MGFESAPTTETREQKGNRIVRRSKEIVDELNTLKRDKYAKEDQMNTEQEETVKQALKMEMLLLDQKIEKLNLEQNALTREVNE